MKLKFTDFEYVYDGSRRSGNNTHGEYVFHDITSWNKLVIDDETRLHCEYQTACFYEHNDFDCPTNSMSLYYSHCSDVIRIIDGLGEEWFQEYSEDKQETLDEIKELCADLDSFEKVSQVYFALRDNVPTIDQFIEASEDVADYEEDEEGNLKLKA